MGETCKRFHAGRHRRGMPIVCGRPVYRDGECRAHWRLRIDAALAAARDEVIAAARQVSALLGMMRDDDLAGPASGNPYGLTPSGGRLLKIHHDALIAALDKMEGK